MLCHALGIDCTRLVLSLCDSATITVLTHVPELVPHTLLTEFEVECDVPPYAAEHGYLSLLEWCLTDGVCIEDALSMCSIATEHGHLNILQYLIERVPSVTKLAGSFYCTVAANEGHSVVLEWLLQQGCVPDKVTYSAAGSSGSLDTVKVLRKYDPRFSDYRHTLRSSALCYGDTASLLEWLKTDK